MTTDTQEAPVTEEATLSTVQVTELGQFVELLTHWHAHQVETLKHIAAIPEGTEMVVGDDGQSIKLEGDVLKAFRTGIELSLGYMGELPFTPEFEEEPVVH